MTKSHGTSTDAKFGPTSAVGADRLEEYHRAAQGSTRRQQVRALTRLIDDYNGLVEAGDTLPAMGAGLALVDAALAIATTPWANAPDWEYKRGFFTDLFPSLAKTLHHPHAASVALAATRADGALRGRSAGRGRPARTSPAAERSTGDRIATAMPQERRDAYALAASTFHDLRSFLAASHEICIDRGTLEREGRRRATAGADASLARCVRRVCATSASTIHDARWKVFVLTRLKQIYHGLNGESAALMGAAIDAAITMEVEAWPTAAATAE